MGGYFREDASGFSVGKGVQLHEYHPRDKITGSWHRTHQPCSSSAESVGYRQEQQQRSLEGPRLRVSSPTSVDLVHRHAQELRVCV